MYYCHKCGTQVTEQDFCDDHGLLCEDCYEEEITTTPFVLLKNTYNKGYFNEINKRKTCRNTVPDIRLGYCSSYGVVCVLVLGTNKIKRRKLMGKTWRITINMDDEEYAPYRKYVEKVYGIAPSGRWSRLTEFSSKIFAKAVKEEMENENN